MSACAPAVAPVALDPNGPTLRQKAAESELRALGAGRFDVSSFAASAEHEAELRTLFDFPRRFFEVPFDAEVTVLQPLTIHTKAELVKRVGDRDWTPEETDREQPLTELFPPGVHPAGEHLKIHGWAAFLRLDPGWRFHLFDSIGL
jgi:hypothetical protein